MMLRAFFVSSESKNALAAQSLVKPALRNRTSTPEILRLYAWAFMDAGQLKRARRGLRTALGAWPNEASLHHAMGVLLLHSERPHRATKHLSAALALDPSHLAARRDLDQALELGDRQAADRFSLRRVFRSAF